VFSDMLGEQGPRTGLIRAAMREISATPAGGVIVVLTQQMPDLLSHFVRTKGAQADSGASFEYLRDYGAGAQVLAALGIHDMILLTNSPRTLIALQGFGLNVVAHRPLEVRRD
ncbi:MAG TPA: 3,4-dihydroxy-2-butanone-4-phosphate synthase, partial [Hyphomicrobiaceae bacterium]|nr:3,4-dihydroxy-2-butanone-4-phosphate synthase [Hyphomicrobiaceae bacterium]